MGLLCNIFEFADKVPSIDDVARAIQSETVESIHFEGTLAMSHSDEEEAKNLKESKSSLRLSGAGVTLTLAADRQVRGRRQVSIKVSLRGRDLVVMGNHPKIWRAACNAIEKLGGVKQQQPTKT
jgi:hypothetical protein